LRCLATPISSAITFFSQLRISHRHRHLVQHPRKFIQAERRIASSHLHTSQIYFSPQTLDPTCHFFNLSTNSSGSSISSPNSSTATDHRSLTRFSPRRAPHRQSALGITGLRILGGHLLSK
jgi:hypothetical protein